MNLKRIGILVIPNINRTIVSRYSFWVYGIFGIFTLIDVGLGWNGRSVTLFSIPLESCCNSREQALLGILHEHFSWVWFFIAFAFLLPKLLFPLGDSFSVSHILWLRLTSCLPYEIATARALLVITCSLWLCVLGFFWALINSLFHQISLIELLVDVEGLVSYVLLSSGIVAALDFGLSINYSGRQFISSFAFLVPSLLLLVFTLINDPKYANYFPYSIPFITGAPPYTQLSVAIPYHFGSAAVLGILLLCFHVMSKVQYSRIDPKIVGGTELP
ncbi:MAG: hypothetical protein H0X31_08610 [Nostocaceae cyanobacterium]|nr:hypothetical protein [Nostocaceae cyanobacterium]